MGNNQSQSVSIAFNEFNNFMTQISQQISNSANIDCKSVQNFNFSMKKATINAGCNISVVQNQTTNCDLQATFTNRQDAGMSNVISTVIDQMASSASKSTIDLLATSYSQQNSDTTVATTIKNEIATNFSEQMANTCFAKSDASQTGVYNFDETICNAPINLGENSQSSCLSSCISTNIMNILSQNTALVQAVNSASNTQSSEASGVGKVISDFISAYRNIIIGIAVVIGLICIFCCIGLVAFGKSDSGKALINTAGDVANNAIAAKKTL